MKTFEMPATKVHPARPASEAAAQPAVAGAPDAAGRIGFLRRAGEPLAVPVKAVGADEIAVLFEEAPRHD